MYNTYITFANKYHQHNKEAKAKQKPPHRTFCEGVFSAPLGARTLDTLIKSQVLYQLS